MSNSAKFVGAALCLLTSCNSVEPARAPDGKKGGTAGEKKGWIYFAVPGETEFSYTGNSFSTYVREVVFRITTQDKTCKSYQAHEIRTYKGAETLSAPVDARCDYELSVAIGRENTQAASGTGAISFDSVYRTETSTPVTIADFNQDKQALYTLRLERTEFGSQVGFNAAWLQAIPKPGDVPNQPGDTDWPPNNPGTDTDPNNPDPNNPNTPDPDPPTGGVTYTKDIAPILNASCTSCHAPGGSRSNSNLSTYQSTFSYKEFVVSKVLDGTMPPGRPLSADQKSKFTQWKDNAYAQ